MGVYQLAIDLDFEGTLFLFVWSHPTRSLIFLMSMIPNKPLYISDTDYFPKTQDALTIEQDGHPTLIYHDRSHIALSREYSASIAFPYGWSATTEEYCIDSNNHPDCLNPDLLPTIEATFIEECLQDPEQQGTLDKHINIIHNHKSRKQLQWLLSSPTPTPDSMSQHLLLTDLYAKVRKQNGSIYHLKKGL
jgi:hypothetical protein